MSSDQYTTILLSLALLLALAHVFGAACARLRQPRFVGEMLVGVLFGHVLTPAGPAGPAALGFAHWIGLTFLMFVSGTHVRRVLSRETRRASLVLLVVGTTIPFVLVFAASSLIPTDALLGPNGGKWSVLVVVATGTAVTSIPVITRIFHDLRILHTQFASLVLGVAILDDVVLWIVAAALTAVAAGDRAATPWHLAEHAAVSIAYLALGLVWAPRMFAAIHRRYWTAIERTAPVAYALAIVLVYVAVAAALGVTVVIAAFLAGVGFVGGTEGSGGDRYTPTLASLERIGFGVFVPLYFVMVGAKLQLGHGFALAMLLAFLVGSSLVRISAVLLASRLVGFVRRDALNVAIATNARGGPGIVLASLVFDAGVISPEFFTALVISAVVTSQLAAVWLASTLRRGVPLLSRIGSRSTRAPGQPRVAGFRTLLRNPRRVVRREPVAAPDVARAQAHR